MPALRPAPTAAAPAPALWRPVLLGWLVLAVLAATAGLRPLLIPDEGRYVGVAWEMLRSGDWAVPTLDGLPYFHKPPLFYWLTAASMRLLGLHELAARAAPLLSATVAAIGMWLFLRRWADARLAGQSLWLLVAQPLFFIGAQVANLDMLVAACITVCILLLAHAVLCLDQGQRAPWALHGAYLAAALGVLAKGLIGVVLPALTLLAWLLWRRRGRMLWRLMPATGVALLALVALPWFVAMELRHPGFAHYFFVVQQLQRFGGGGFNNVQPVAFYPAVLLLCTLPWWPAWVAWARQGWRARGTGWGDRTDGDPLRALMVAWAAVVTVFFSLPQSKLLGYLLPALVPVAVLTATAHRATWPAPQGRAPARDRRLWAGAALALALSLGIVAALGAQHRKSSAQLAGVLRGRLAPGDAVVMLDRYRFDLAFYARLRQPALVVQPWDAPGLTRGDSWPRELADAAGFAPAAGAAVLVTDAQLAARLPAMPCAWVLGDAQAPVAHAWLRGAERVAMAGNTALWRLPAH